MRYLTLFLLLTALASADSPLTSTPFHQAYADMPLVMKASKTHTLDQEMTAYLLDSKKPLHQRLAVCNALET